MSKLYIVKYSHRQGVEIIPCLIPEDDDKPEITNSLLTKLGMLKPELERMDESAKWLGPFSIESLPDVTQLVEVESMVDRIKEAVDHLNEHEIRTLAKTLGVE